MRIRSVLSRAVLIAAVAAATGVIAAPVQAGVHGRTAPECATATVKGIPVLNTSMEPESIKSTVTNCSTTTETVQLGQHISFTDDSARGPWGRHWTITVAAGQTVTKWRSFPYSCCGGYTVTDFVHSMSGQQLAKAQANFTFA
jgi:hypothetical protein